MGADGAALAKRYERTLYIGVLLANYFAAVVLSIYFFLAAKMYPSGRSPGRLMAEMCVAGIPLALAASASGVLLSRRWIRPAMAWLPEGVPPTHHERIALS